MEQKNQSRGKRKERSAVVVSHNMRKTIVVKVERRVRHPVYGKEMKLVKKYFVHDEKDEAKVGDRVVIAETRPLSKLKRWRLVSVVRPATSMPRQAEPVQDSSTQSQKSPAESGPAAGGKIEDQQS